MANSATTEFVFNIGGQRVSEWNASTHAQLKGHYYWGSKPVAFYTTANDGAAAAHFEHQDWLGTERMRTGYNGGIEGEFTSLPWGDSQTTTSGSDQDAYHYAMTDYDGESNTDHAQFRQYSPTEGRWMKPDPYSGSYDMSNPQSFNRYEYAMNNPLSNIDPSGLSCITNTSEDGTVTYVDDGDGQGCAAAGVGPGPNGTNDGTPGVIVDGSWLDGPDLSDPMNEWLYEQAMTNYGIGAGAPNNGVGSALKSWWKDVSSCFTNYALPTLESDLNPLTPGVMTPSDMASQLSQASLQAAAAWSVQRGLTVPLRSSIVRAGLSNAEALGKLSGVLAVAGIDVALADAVYAEYKGCL